MSAVRILRQQIPFARSILWAPTSAARPAGDMPFPVFLKQSALQAIYEHLATIPPPGQGILGFLLGDRCECPVTGVSYSVIDAALRLNQTIYGDRSRDVITRLWQRLEGQLEAQEAHLIGWYHTHAPAPLEMSVHDVETHEQYFGEPWQVGIIVGTDPETPAGAFFRAGNDATWVRAPQPFYELLNEDSVRPDGKKRSFMTWKTYRAYNPPGLQPRAGTNVAAETRAVPPPRPPQPVDEREDETEEPGREEPAGLEHMPQAELEEPRRTELDEPASPEADPDEAGEVEETAEAKEPEEWEDPGALRFLSAADDMPPPPPAPAAAAPPPPHYRPPAHAPAAFATQDTSEQEVEEQVEDQVEEQVEEQIEEEIVEVEAEVEEQPPVRRPKRRRSPGRVRRLIRKLVRVVAFGLAGLVIVGGGILAWPYVPALLQRLRAFAPSGHPAPSRSPAPAVSPRAAPVAAPTPAVARPARTPRPEFALLDQAGDSLERALQAYNGRVRLFEARKLDCPVLGRGMLRVGRAFTSYGMQRNARVTLDPERVTRDRDLRAGVDSAGRQFQRSQCERG